MPYSFEHGRYLHAFPDLKAGGGDIALNPDQAIDIERNLNTFATSRSGKGVTQIIPNLLRWPHSALVIDPKGEAAERTWQAREAMGQAVHVLDPFESCADIPARIRATLNPLDEINPDSPHAFRQINAMADGLVMRHSAEAGHWDSGTQQLLAGLIAHALTAPDFDGRRNLNAIRDILTEPDSERLGGIFEAMSRNPSCGRLPMTGASKVLNTGTEAGHFLSGATTNTVWLDDPLMSVCLADSSFRLSDLKRRPTTVYLVLPFDALGDYGRFLRLFVRMALFHMMQKMPDGSLKGERCLFILDEFFSLGRIDEIAKAAGGLPGFNLHLWPFLQDLPQLIELYGPKASNTFIANADATFFYGVNDHETADYVSKGAGVIKEHELHVAPPPKPQDDIPKRFRSPRGSILGLAQRLLNLETADYRRFREATMPPIKDNAAKNAEADIHARARAEFERDRQNRESCYQDEMTRYRQAERVIGQPRLQPEDVFALTARDDERRISPFSLLLKGGVCYRVAHKGYFE